MNPTRVPEFLTPIALDRDTFMRRLIAGLGHLNEGILGSELTGAYIMNVGLSMGAAIEEEYKRFWKIDRPFTLDEYAHVIVDLKQKIKGNFSLVSKDPFKVVVRTTSCPFDILVRQSPSLCFITSSVFGGIAARNFGYGKVVLHQRIALGDPGCYVTIYLQRTPEAEAMIGKEYAPDLAQASTDIAGQLRLMEQVQHLRRELSETTSRWEEVMQEAAEAIGVFDYDGRVIYANARWRDLLGVEGGEMVGSIFERLVHAEDQAGIHTAFQQARRGHRLSGHQFRLRHRDGTWRILRMSLGVIRDDRGQSIGTLGIVQDITREREVQRLKEDLLATSSHELRTPITTIRGMTQLLLRTVEQGETLDPNVLAKRLQVIQRETDRLAQLSTDLADVARLQSSSLSIQRKHHDLGTIVAEAVMQRRELLGASQRLHLVLQTATTPLPVQVDRIRIEQVIANLLDNAVKYSPDGGQITVKTQQQNDQAQVWIGDQGIGIPEQDLTRLFTPFFRASNVSARHFPGMGLGLYLSRTIMEAHGGTLSVISHEGQGSTFLLSLPLANRELEEKER